MACTRTQEFLAEVFGSTVVILFGCGCVAMVMLWPDAGAVPHGGYTSVVLGWGLAVTFGVCVSGSISGAYLNPAVTLALAITGRFPWAKLPHYVLAQFIGAVLGAALLFAVYYAKWIQVGPALDHTTGTFSTFPAVPGFFDPVVGSAILLDSVLAVGDKFNISGPLNLSPIAIGLLVLAIGISFGGMQGYAINPARDLGPRLFAVTVGFRNNGLTDGNGAWLPPVLGPIVGGPLGALAYDLFIGRALIASGALRARTAGRDPDFSEDGAAPRAVTPSASP